MHVNVGDVAKEAAGQNNGAHGIYASCLNANSSRLIHASRWNHDRLEGLNT